MNIYSNLKCFNEQFKDSSNSKKLTNLKEHQISQNRRKIVIKSKIKWIVMIMFWAQKNDN